MLRGSPSEGMETTLAKKSKLTKKSLFNGLLVKLLAAAIGIGCAVTVVTVNRECDAKDDELTGIQEKIDQYEADNSELQRILDNEDMSAYIEKVAMEKYGYAYSDERRFYDTSRD